MIALKQKGFTLIETIIVIALLSVMILVITELFFGTSMTYRTQNAELDINFNARTSLDDIDASVRQAIKVLGVYGSYSASSTVLILEIPSLSSSNQIVPGAYDKVIYHLEGDDLIREVIPESSSVRLASTRPVGSNITSFAFSYNNADYDQVTQITTQATYTIANSRESRSLTVSSKSSLRN